jgi:uncharacterized membrane protein
MAFCSKCGTQLGAQSAACPQCGAAQQPASHNPAAQSGLAENVAGLLCYVLGWVTGIIFLLIDKRPFVRFHAAQSLVVFGGLHVFRMILAAIFGWHFFFGGWQGFGPAALLLHLSSLLGFVLWILLMIKAYQGERFKIPVASEIAEGIAGK